MYEMDSKYHVGEKVFVKSVAHCSYGQNHEMRDLVGAIVTIKRVLWDKGFNQYSYRIQEDDGWSWDDSCFETTMRELPIPDISGADILGLLG